MKVKVATVSMATEYRSAQKIEDNLKYIEDTLEAMRALEPDLVALPEVFPYVGTAVRARDVKESHSEEIKEFMSEMARKHSLYLAGSIYERREEGLFNACLLFDRKGKLVGRYDKIHPTEPEMEEGVMPGDEEQKPLQTEFGKIGFQICFDANWHLYWKKQADEGAKMLIFSSAYPAGRILNAIALLYNIYIVASTWELRSGIIDDMGRWLVKTDRFSWWVWSEVDLDKGIFHWDFQEEKLRQIKRKFGDKVRVETFGDEALFTIEVTQEDIKLQDLVKEFALLPYRDYLRRAENAQNEKRKRKA